MGLPAFFINRPITVLMIFLGITILGLISLNRLPLELMPNTSYPVVTININHPGVPPTEVENMVTTKVEEAVATVAHLRTIESSSKDGKSETILEFEPGTDMNFAALEVREKFAKVRNKLPKDIRKPILGKYDVADAPVMILALLSDKITPEEMRRLTDMLIKEPLGRVSGVSNVEVSGGRERKILVELDQSRLQSYGISIEHVVKVMHDNNRNLLAGSYELNQYKYLVRAIGQFKTVAGIEKIGLASTVEGNIITLGDVASIRDSFLEAAGYSRHDTLPTVTLYIHKERQANTIEVCNQIKAALEKLAPRINKYVRVVTVLDQSLTIHKAITTVKRALINGALLAGLVLFIALRNIRSPFIIAVSIPLAIIAAFIPMYFQNITLNTMTLSGLALACGSLVDASIVVLDNIFKKTGKACRLREAAVAGSEEVGFAIVASTITTVVVFLPIIFVNKEIRLIYMGLGLTVIYSLMASLLVAQTLLPVMASRIIKDSPPVLKPASEKKKILGSKVFTSFYRRLLSLAIRYRYIFLGVLVVLLGLSFYLSTKIGSEFMGRVEENKVTVNLTLPAGTKLDISNNIVMRVERFLAKVPEIKNMSSLVEQSRSEIRIEFYPMSKRRRSTKKILDELRPQLAQFRPAYVYFEEKQEVGTKMVVVDLFGFDYIILKQLAVSIANRMETLPGLSDVRIRMKEGRPEMRFHVDKGKAMQLNLEVKSLAEEINTQMRGVIATYFHTEGEEVETIVRLKEKFRKTLDDINKLTVTDPRGEKFYLSQIGTFEPGLGPSEIWRKNKSRMIQASANVSTDLGSATENVRNALAVIDFPKGYYYRFGGNYEKMMTSSRQLGLAVLLTIVLVYMVLAAFFESYYQPIIIILSVFMAVIGVVLALYLTGKPKSVGVYIGLLMLAGMVVNPGIILVDKINQLTTRGVKIFKAILSASQSRLRPILMTLITAILGLLPMALDRSEGSNLWAPLAITVVGGLLTSGILTLFFIPCIYIIMQDISATLRGLTAGLRAWYYRTSSVRTASNG